MLQGLVIPMGLGYVWIGKYEGLFLFHNMVYIIRTYIYIYTLY